MPTCRRYTSFIPWKSSRFCRKTVVLTSRSRLEPAASRIARRFAKTCSVCSPIAPPVSSLSPDFKASWPETKTKPLAALACEYGAPWNGAGADSVRTTVLSAICSSFACRLRECNAQRLEDRLEYVLRVGAVQQAHMQRDAGSVRELLEETPRDVRTQPADAGLREVDIRDEQRVVRRLEHDVRERFGRRHDREAVAASRLLPQRHGECAPEGAARPGHFGLGGVGLDLEREVEARIVRQAPQEVVEHRQPGLDACRARAVKLDANATPSGRRHGRREATGVVVAEDRPFGPCGRSRRVPILVSMVGAALLAALAFAQPVTVAVVDTGANVEAPVIAAKHPSTYDIRTRSRDVADTNGHGTQVASIIAREGGSSRLLVVRAGSSSGAFTDANEAAGIRYAVEHGARIINLSLGGPRTSAVERAAVRYALAHNVLVIAAAGDDYANRPEYPAALLGSGGLAVAAVGDNGSRALFS